MTQEIAKQLQCVVLNGQVEKWLEYDKAQIIREAVKRGDKFVEIGGELINTFSIVGVFNAQTMEEKNRRRNGDWQCSHGRWWGKFLEKCECDKMMSGDVRQRMEAQVKAKYGITD